MIMRKSLAASVHISSAWPGKRGRLIRRTAILIGGLAFIASLTLAGIHAFVPNDPTAVIALPVSGTAGSIGLDGTGTRAVVVGRGNSRSVVVLDTSTKAVVRSLQAPGAVTALVVGKRLGIAAILSDGSSPAHGAITFLATRTGAVLRRLATPPQCVQAVVDESLGWVYVISIGQLTAAGAIAGHGRLVAYDLRSGARRIDTLVGRQPWAEAVDPRMHRIFVANLLSGTVSVVDGRSGRVARTVRVGAQPAAMAIDAQTGRVFVADGVAHTISILNIHSGIVLRTVLVDPISFPTALVVARAQRLVLMVDDHGAVLALDAATGARRYRTMVAGTPSAIAVDERRGLVVLTGTGTSLSRLSRDLHLFGHGQLSWAGENEADGVSILSARDGRLLTTYRGSVTEPDGVVVDEVTGRIFALNTTTNAVDVLQE